MQIAQTGNAADTGAAHYSGQWLSGAEGLDRLSPIWQSLFDACAYRAFVNDWRWHQALQQHLCPEPLHYLLLSDASQPVAILALQRVWRRRGPFLLRYLILPYHVAVDQSDLLIRQGHERAELWAAILDALRLAPFGWDAIEFSLFSQRSCLYRLARSAELALAPHGDCAFIPARAGALLAAVSRRQLKNSDRHQRNAEAEFGALAFQQVSEAGALATAYEQFLQLEASGWKGQAQGAIALRADARGFYQALLRSFGASGQALINLLYLGDHLAAAQLGLRLDGCLYLLKIAYDERFAQVGPGGMLLAECLRQEQQRASREVNLVTHPVWAERWHPSCEPVYLLLLFNQTAYARALAWLRRAVQPLMRLWRHT